MTEVYARLFKEILEFLNNENNEYGKIERVAIRDDMVEKIFFDHNLSDSDIIADYQKEMSIMFPKISFSSLSKSSGCVYIIEYDTGTKIQRFETAVDNQKLEEPMFGYIHEFRYGDIFKKRDDNIEVSKEELEKILDGSV